MVPIFVLALRRGLVPGMIAGAVYGCVDLLIDPFVVHPVQLLLDYPVAYCARRARWSRLARVARTRRT